MKPEEQQELDDIMENMDFHIKAAIIKAKLCREYYVELVNQDFTKHEALELCKHFNG